ncbi:MAG: NUDIX hydrolase [Phycisphaerales bacterium]|nr:NUDIX hydrolase [Phycisphaerales bacterium]
MSNGPVGEQDASGGIDERIVGRRLIHKGKKFSFEMLTIRPGSSTKTYDREIVRHPGAVVIVPVLAPDELVMIRNRRVAVGEELWEFPAGTLEAGEAPETCAPRELIEETGYRAGETKPLGWFYTTPGMTDERMHAFLATDLNHVGQALEEDESIRVEVVQLSDAMAMLADGRLRDGKSMLALLLALRHADSGLGSEWGGEGA